MSSYEQVVIQILKKDKINFQREKTFQNLKRGAYRFDFYIPNHFATPIIIEVDGEQHFKPIYGRQNFLRSQEHDRIKNSYCLAHCIPLYRIPYWEIKNLEKVEDLFQPKFLVKNRWHNDKLVIPH